MRYVLLILVFAGQQTPVLSASNHERLEIEHDFLQGVTASLDLAATTIASDVMSSVVNQVQA